MRLSLTKQAEYALRALVWLAREAAGPPGGGEPGRRKAAAIAAGAGIPPVFAARVLAVLQRRGLVHARAGQRGGYLLARPPDEITLLEVVEGIEGPLLTQRCVLRESRCGTGGRYCVLHRSWSAAQEALRASLEATTVGAALAGAAGDDPSGQPPLPA